MYVQTRWYNKEIVVQVVHVKNEFTEIVHSIRIAMIPVFLFYVFLFSHQQKSEEEDDILFFEHKTHERSPILFLLYIYKEEIIHTLLDELLTGRIILPTSSYEILLFILCLPIVIREQITLRKVLFHIIQCVLYYVKTDIHPVCIVCIAKFILAGYKSYKYAFY